MCIMFGIIGDPNANAMKTIAIPILILFETLLVFSID